MKINILEADLGLGDLLGGGTFTESVVETTVDILQVLCTASTWGSSALGFGGPVELKIRVLFFVLKVNL